MLPIPAYEREAAFDGSRVDPRIEGAETVRFRVFLKRSISEISDAVVNLRNGKVSDKNVNCGGIPFVSALRQSTPGR